MGGCCADYCTNSAKKGFHMYRLPRDKRRLKVWIDNINRQDWVPQSSSRLCHVHFTEDMWDKTRDGKHCLKSNAVPTIFGQFGERIILVQTIQQAVYEPAQIRLETEDVPSEVSEMEESGTEASHKRVQIKLETKDVPSEVSEIEKSDTEASYELPLQEIHFYTVMRIAIYGKNCVDWKSCLLLLRKQSKNTRKNYI